MASPLAESPLEKIFQVVAGIDSVPWSNAVIEHFGVYSITHVCEDRRDQLEIVAPTDLICFPQRAAVICRVSLIFHVTAWGIAALADFNSGWIESGSALEPSNGFKDSFAGGVRRHGVRRRCTTSVRTGEHRERPRDLHLNGVRLVGHAPASGVFQTELVWTCLLIWSVQYTHNHRTLCSLQVNQFASWMHLLDFAGVSRSGCNGRVGSWVLWPFAPPRKLILVIPNQLLRLGTDRLGQFIWFEDDGFCAEAEDPGFDFFQAGQAELAVE